MMTGSGGMIKKRQFGAPPEMDSSYKPKKAAPGAPPQQANPAEQGGSQKVAGPPGGTGTGVPGAPTMQENLAGGGMTGTTGGQQMHPLTPQPQPTPAAVPSMADMIKTNQQTMQQLGLGPGGQPPGSPGAPPMPGGAEQIGTPPSAGMAGKAPKTKGTANQGGGTTSTGNPGYTTGVYHTMDQPGSMATFNDPVSGTGVGTQAPPPAAGGYAPPQLPETAGAGMGGNAGPGFDPYQAPPQEDPQQSMRKFGSMLGKGGQSQAM